MEFLAELHPQVIHFPIAILILYSVIEIIAIILNHKFLQKMAHLLLAIGVVSAIAAVLTGNQAAAHAAEVNTKFSLPKELIEEHETYASYTLWYFLAVLVFRTFLVLKKKMEENLRFILIPMVLLGSFLIYKTGDYGGQLVYNYGVGTKPIESIDKDVNSGAVDD